MYFSKIKKFAKRLNKIIFSKYSLDRYSRRRRNISIMMILITVIPLTLMAIINSHQYQKNLKTEIVNPIHSTAIKASHSLELFLEERLSAIRFIASSFDFDTLSDTRTLNRIFRVLRKEFGGYVDLGLITSDGTQVNYAGPYDLLGKNYSEQHWFQVASVRGVYISNVFMGYRETPHIAMAVQHLTDSGKSWYLRATMNTEKFKNIIASMGLAASCDAFLINHKGILQTHSKYYGKVLEPCALSGIEKNITLQQVDEITDNSGRKIFIAATAFNHHDFTLVIVKPSSIALKSLYTLKNNMFFLYVSSVVLIILIILRLTGTLIKRIRQSDEKRELAFRELEHSQKLSSIGRLAAGVAHEINNPLAIIREKAGLMRDLFEYGKEDKTKFINATGSIINSVERCKKITHRLLGFARRIETSIEKLNLGEVLQDTLGFLEKEAQNRNIEVKCQFEDSLPQISSDQGQLQQVFLNLLTNAFAAVKDGGIISIKTWTKDTKTVGISIRDNGHGMTETVRQQIFEPFFTTKKGYGTGLGLSITYGIIKKLGGDISVESKEGKGTAFTVYLPITQEV
ncbi:MAG: two-component sensor histidine kinase [Deltaproteobacteria bacterium]|nr:two-component sensor histidine kinase [Deltaproteobacteria bacterium]